MTMKPRVLKIDPHNIDLRLIQEAADAIKRGELVAFPTETVYGLGANAFDAKAVSRIFEAKKRPLDDPLIVHIEDRSLLDELAAEVPEEARRLSERFWPGPLTLIFKKTGRVPDIVTTGLDTVAIRMPSSPVAASLIKAAGVPVAAPSANLFGRPSPTTAMHVCDDLDGAVDIVIDGGKTRIGVESTVVELSGDEAIVLRPGGVTVEELRTVLAKVKVYSEGEALKKSPGKYPRHYSPRAKVVLIARGGRQVEEVLSAAEKHSARGEKVGIMARKEHSGFYGDYRIKILGPGDDLESCAGELFHILREFDSENTDVIIAEAVDEKGIGLAIMNRLRKAAAC